MNKKFELTGFLKLKPGRGRKSITSISVEDVATVLQEGKSSGVQTISARAIVRSLDMTVGMVPKILHNILLLYPYTITHVQELLPYNLPIKYNFALEFFCLHGSRL